MSIKNVLVTYNGTESSNAALQAAVLVQKKYGAHLTGILTQCYQTPAAKNAQSWMPKAVFTTIAQLESEERERIRQNFLTATNSIDDDMRHWVAKRGDPSSTVADYSSLFDLTIIGRRDVLNNPDHLDLHPDKIALQSGKPVLVIPKDHQVDNLNDHAIIAWDGRRAACRALSDAMNILETKKIVTILRINTGSSENNLTDISIEEILLRHGIRTKSVTLDTKGASVEKVMLNYLNSIDPTLLIMGAYEHSKFKRRSISPLSSSIIGNTKMTVFMSY